jgi:hypothetical protein
MKARFNKMGVVWQKRGRGQPQIIGALHAHSFNRTPLLKFLDPPLIILVLNLITAIGALNGPILYIMILDDQLRYIKAVITDKKQKLQGSLGSTVNPEIFIVEIFS